MASGVRDEDSLRLVHCLSTRNESIRKQGLNMISKLTDSWIEGYGSPVNSIYMSNGQKNGTSMSNGKKNGSHPLLKEHLPDFVRLAYECPFEDVREFFCELIADIQERENITLPKPSTLGPSSFIPNSSIIPVNTSEDQTQMVFIDAFLQNNRLDHLTQLMGYHPTYLENFLRTQQYLLRGDGPLPFHYRHYIAIMAASRHQCTYLIHLHEEEFILQNGDPDWLKGPTHIPKKIRNLFELNKLMAHRPWLINKSHIDKLTRGKDNWSLSELMQAICLMAHFHAMCSFVYGCGVRNELDHNGESLQRRLSMSDDSDSDTQGNEPEVKIEVLMERMKKLNEDDSDDPTEEERLKRFESIENQSVELISSSIPSPRVEVLKYCEDPEFCYQDFAKRDNIDSIPTFRAQDYNWEEHGFSLANRLLSDIGSNLEDRFNIAINLTYYTMGKVKNVDTSAFRCAIWNYIHCLYGIMHDDFNYSQVNQLLDRNLKSYIKTVTCYPERLTKKDYDSCMQEFRHSEKVHVNLMLLEARLQGELLYSLRAVMQHMT